MDNNQLKRKLEKNNQLKRKLDENNHSDENLKKKTDVSISWGSDADIFSTKSKKVKKCAGKT